MIPAIAIADELLTEIQAVARIPGRDSEVRAWLRAHGSAPMSAGGKAAEGRRYLGAEIDPDRHAQALTALARYLAAM